MVTEWEAGGNDFAANGQIWGVNGRGKANAWGFSVPSLDDVGTPFGYVSTRPVLVLFCGKPKIYITPIHPTSTSATVWTMTTRPAGHNTMGIGYILFSEEETRQSKKVGKYPSPG